MASSPSPPRSQWPAFAALLVSTLAFGWLAWELLGLRDDVAVLRSQQQALTGEHQDLGAQTRHMQEELARQKSETQALEQQVAERQTVIAELEQAAAAQAAAAQAAAAQAAAALNRPQRAAAPVVASMVLTATVRGEGMPTLALSPATDTVELRVDLQGDADFQAFRASLVTSEGAHVWTGADLETSRSEWGSELVVRLPAALLQADEFELGLEGLGRDAKIYGLHRHRFKIKRID